jgi:hypothetical protein
MASKNRLIPGNTDAKRGINPLQYKNIKNQKKVANVALDSGAVATLVFLKA